ncbi:MAG: BMP family ABC transporter substrate-binding protein [Clostridiaceae bacterium]|nr:BMP family ABC transporter substrate-binding protein [Clostridiaceae bacterium]
MTNDYGPYLAARRLGLKEYSNYISKGRNGYLPFLDGVLKNIEIVSEVDLGISDIPLRKVKGTYSYLRSISFARNYMPLMEPESEFALKWMNVYNIQNNEGLRDSIKVYEYLNWFYIIEGNKRVSVLKYLDVYSFPASITRLIPKYDENNPDIRIYYEFMDFHKKTGINEIWMSREKSFNELWELIKDYKPESSYVEEKDRFKYFSMSVYNMFRKAFYKLGGDKLPITTGDAFLDFIKIYGINEHFTEEELEQRIWSLLAELKYYSGSETVDVLQGPTFKQENSLVGRIAQRIRTDVIKVGFVHASDVKRSSWTYSHELGRMHLSHALKKNVETVSRFDVPQSIEAAEILQELVNEGCKVIFTTAPSLINATLKAAMDNQDCNFLNCSCMHSFKHVNTYFGRIHEPRFLSGMVAGAMTRTDKLGYIAPLPTVDILSGLNAFTIGARMVNPRVKVYVKWAHHWKLSEVNQELTRELFEEGADIVSHQNTLANRRFSREYGVYTIKYDKETNEIVPDVYLAVPVWNWGIFYEKYIQSILSGSTKLGIDNAVSGSVKNYWWGMDSGLLDFFYATNHLPPQTCKLISFVKDSIISQSYRVFSGPIYDNNQNLIVPEGEELNREEILSMDWLADGIIGELPNMEDYKSAQDLSTGKIV